MAQPTVTKPAVAAARKPRAVPTAVLAAPATFPEPELAVPAPVAAATVAPPASIASSTVTLEENVMTDTMKNVAEQIETDAKATFAKFGFDTQATVEKGKQGLQDYASFQKGNVEAIVESARIAAKGLETLGQEAAAYAKKSFDHTSETLKALAAVKSPAELLKLQADYVRASFDALVAQTSRSTEASLKLAGEVAQPLQNRLALASEKMKIAA